jgi:uncharacterized protein YggL (DUF469 family)
MEFRRSKFSRRIRKKKRIGEFREYGFLLDVYCGEDHESEILDSVIDMVISKKMFLAGGGDPEKYSFFITDLKKESDKEWLQEQIKSIENVYDVITYKTVDLWHDNSEIYFREADKIRKEYGEKKGTS